MWSLTKRVRARRAIARDLGSGGKEECQGWSLLPALRAGEPQVELDGPCLLASVLCFAGLATGFPEEKCHLSRFSPHIQVDERGAAGALHPGVNFNPVVADTAWAGLRGPWRLWVWFFWEEMCQRPQRGEMFFLGLSTKFLKPRKLLLKCSNVLFLHMYFLF